MTVYTRMMDVVPKHANAGRRALLLVLLVLAGTVGSAVGATDARAVNYSYCTSIIGAYGNCTGSAVYLRGNQAFDDYGSNRVCAGAVYYGSFYGGYACGYGYAGICYGGGLLLNPRVHNGEPFAQSMHGRAYHSENCP